MFPFRDNIPARNYPFVTNALVWLNILVFVYQSSLGEQGFMALIETWGLVPGRVTGFATPGEAGVLLPFLTSMFLHGSWFHVLGNVWFLYLFGDNVEDRMGPWRFLWFYLFAGTVAGLAQVLTHGSSIIPMVGASGAVAGVLGAYIVMYPHARVATLLWLGFFVTVIELPAVTFLGYWFLIQLISGLVAIPMGEVGGGIAWWAHVGGFAVGFIFARFICKECALARHPEDARPYYR